MAGNVGRRPPPAIRYPVLALAGLACSARTMKQQRGQCVIALRCHHHLGEADVKRCLNRLTSGQSLVEADMP